jgi:magnesium transporter
VPINATQIKVIRKLLRSGATTRVMRLLQRIHPADMADLFSELNPTETKQFVDVLFTSRKAGATLRELPEALIVKLLDMISDERLAQMIGRQAPDDAVMFLQLLEEDRQREVMALIEPEDAREIERLMRHPEGTAGSVMTTEVLALEQDATTADALNEIRTRGDELEAIFYLYVVDDARRLKGVVPLRKLILAPDDIQLKDLMLTEPISGNVNDDQEEVAALVTKYNWLSLPVTDDDGTLVGVITVDDVIDVIHEEATEDFYHMAGLDEEDRVFTPVLQSARKRLGWILFNLGTAFVAAFVVGLFEATIQSIVALAVFMPVVAGLGGNSGSQSLTVIIRGIALGELEFSSAFRAVFKEFTVGLLVGAAAGVVTAGVVYGLSSAGVLQFNVQPLWLGLVLFLAMLANMAVGALVGAAIPLLLKALRLDPALGSHILVTAVTDTFGFFVFLGLATLMMSRLLG